jgi:WD40 repeat protein
MQKLTESRDYDIRKFNHYAGIHKGEVKCLLNEKIFNQIFVISGSADRTIKIWDIDPKSKDIIQTLTGHSGTILCLAYSKKTDTIFSGSTDKTLKIWKYTSFKLGKTKVESFLCILGMSAIKPSASST